MGLLDCAMISICKNISFFLVFSMILTNFSKYKVVCHFSNQNCNKSIKIYAGFVRLPKVFSHVTIKENGMGHLGKTNI